MKKAKTWERTGTPGLLRHRSGNYYGRISVAGKMKFIPLDTKIKAVADVRFSEHRTRILKGRKAARKAGGGRGTMGDLMILLRQQIESDTDIKAQTRARYLQDVNFCVKTWPELEKLRPDELNEDVIRAWKGRAMTQGTGFKPRGSKTTETKGKSGRCFNGGLSVVRRLLDIAMRHGAVHENVVVTATKKLRAKDCPRPAYSPPPEILTAIFNEIQAGSGIGGWGQEVADFCRGLAYSGCRVAEGGAVLWSDVNFTEGKVRIRGTKTESSDRTLPMNTALRELLERIQKRRREQATIKIDGEPYVNPAERVFRVGEAQNSIDRACKKLGTQRLTHHNLRDYFCTRSLLSGVPIRVLAEWLGHADKGALLLKRYSHIMAEDSSAQAARVNFGGAA